MVYIFCIYVLLSGLILVVLSKGNRKEWLLKFIIVTFLPIIGWFMPVIWPKRLIPNNGEHFEAYMNKQTEDIPPELMEEQVKFEKEKELNIVPIEDALIVSDFVTRRKMMINILKQDSLQYLDVIRTAVANEDTETSHYAVTAVLEIKRNLSFSLQKFEVEFNQSPTDSHIAFSYADVLKEYMRSGFLDEQTLKKQKYTYIQILQQIIQNGDAEEKTFEEKISTEMELYEYIAAEQTGLQYLQTFSQSESAYICLMSIYFTTKSLTKMQHTLNELKASTIKLSNHALTIVRYWSGGVEHEHKLETSH